MPSKGAQGQGPNTVWKQRGLGAAMTVSLRIAKKAPPKFPYWHIDLNCGSGFNEKADCVGSPVTFLQAAESEERTNFRAFFIDRDLECIAALERRLADWPDKTAFANCRVIKGFNQERLPEIGNIIAGNERPQYAIGTVLCDPNGAFGDQTPHEALMKFARKFPRIDLIFNLNIRTHLMGRGNIRRGRTGWPPDKFWPAVNELPGLFSREHWLVREISATTGDKFIVLVGRNISTGDHKNLGFVHMDSDEGQEIVARTEPKEAAA